MKDKSKFHTNSAKNESLLNEISFLKERFLLSAKSGSQVQRKSQSRPGADPGEVKWVNFHPPFLSPPSFFFFLIPQPGFGSITLLQKFTPHFKILDPRLQTATKFASTANHGAVNNSAHLNSVTSIPEGLNVKRSDPRISHEMVTLKVNTSKPQQPGAFVIEHQTEKSAVLRRKVVIPFPSVSGLELDERKITLDTSEPPRMFYKRKNESRVNSAWSEHFENLNPAGSSLSSTTNKTRVQFQLQQPNESFSTLIHSDGNLKKAAEAGIQETYTHSSQEMLEPEAFSPVAKDATLVRAAV